MTRQEAGRLGGQATVKKHGTSHMRAIGKQGAETTWTRYKMVPISTSRYGMVDRGTNKIVAIF